MLIYPTPIVPAYSGSIGVALKMDYRRKTCLLLTMICLLSLFSHNLHHEARISRPPHGNFAPAVLRQHAKTEPNHSSGLKCYILPQGKGQ
jgi:hypothetical protein